MLLKYFLVKSLNPNFWILVRIRKIFSVISCCFFFSIIYFLNRFIINLGFCIKLRGFEQDEVNFTVKVAEIIK